MGKWFEQYKLIPRCVVCDQKVGPSRWYTINNDGSATCMVCINIQDAQKEQAEEDKEKESRKRALERYKELQQSYLDLAS